MQWPARCGAPLIPAPARHACTALLRRYVPASRARRSQPGGDPAAPIGGEPPDLNRRQTSGGPLAAGRPVAAPRRRPSARARNAHSGGPHGPPLRETAGSPRNRRGDGEPADRRSANPRLRSDWPPPAEARSSNTRSPRSPPTSYRFTMVAAQARAHRLRLALTREPPARLGSPSCAA